MTLLPPLPIIVRLQESLDRVVHQAVSVSVYCKAQKIAD